MFIKIVSTAALISTFLIAGCTSTTGNSTGTVTPAMKATVDGTSFIAIAVVGSKVGGTIFVQGSSLGGNIIQIAIPDTATTGQRAMGITYAGTYTEGTTAYSTLFSGNGTLNITLINSKSVTGTFSFTGATSLTSTTRKVIASGEFAGNF